MKVEYNEGEGALVSGKIDVRWRLDTSKIEVRRRYNTMKGMVPQDQVRFKLDGG